MCNKNKKKVWTEFIARVSSFWKVSHAYVRQKREDSVVTKILLVQMNEL